jgi:hypothetical protein
VVLLARLFKSDLAQQRAPASQVDSTERPEIVVPVEPKP